MQKLIRVVIVLVVCVVGALEMAGAAFPFVPPPPQLPKRPPASPAPSVPLPRSTKLPIPYTPGVCLSGMYDRVYSYGGRGFIRDLSSDGCTILLEGRENYGFFLGNSQVPNCPMCLNKLSLYNVKTNTTEVIPFPAEEADNNEWYLAYSYFSSDDQYVHYIIQDVGGSNPMKGAPYFDVSYEIATKKTTVIKFSNSTYCEENKNGYKVCGVDIVISPTGSSSTIPERVAENTWHYWYGPSKNNKLLLTETSKFDTTGAILDIANGVQTELIPISMKYSALLAEDESFFALEIRDYQNEQTGDYVLIDPDKPVGQIINLFKAGLEEKAEPATCYELNNFTQHYAMFESMEPMECPAYLLQFDTQKKFALPPYVRQARISANEAVIVYKTYNTGQSTEELHITFNPFKNGAIK